MKWNVLYAQTRVISDPPALVVSQCADRAFSNYIYADFTTAHTVVLFFVPEIGFCLYFCSYLGCICLCK